MPSRSLADRRTRTYATVLTGAVLGHGLIQFDGKELFWACFVTGAAIILAFAFDRD